MSINSCHLFNSIIYHIDTGSGIVLDEMTTGFPIGSGRMTCDHEEDGWGGPNPCPNHRDREEISQQINNMLELGLISGDLSWLRVTDLGWHHYNNGCELCKLKN